MTTKQYNLIGIVLSCVSFVLLGAFLFLSSPPQKTVQQSPSQAKQSIPRPQQLPPKIKEDYNLIIKNNLFHPQRGKAILKNEKEIEQRNKQQAILKFELKGIYHSENRHAALIVFKGSSQQPLKGDLKKADADLYYQGNEISDGYVLTEVKKRSVVITRGNEKIEIELTMLQGPEKPSKTLDSKPVQSPAIKK